MHRLLQRYYETWLEIYSCRGSKYKYCSLTGCDVIYLGRQVPAFPKDLLSFFEQESCISLRKLGSSLPNYSVTVQKTKIFGKFPGFLGQKDSKWPFRIFARCLCLLQSFDIQYLDKTFFNFVFGHSFQIV